MDAGRRSSCAFEPEQEEEEEEEGRQRRRRRRREAAAAAAAAAEEEEEIDGRVLRRLVSVDPHDLALLRSIGGDFFVDCLIEKIGLKRNRMESFCLRNNHSCCETEVDRKLEIIDRHWSN